MDQPIGTADVHEGPEVGDGGNPALPRLAFLQILDQPLLHRVAALLHRHALREDEAVAVAVDLDHLQRKRRTDQPRHIGLLRGVIAATNLGHLRGGHEAAHAIKVDQEATLVVIGDLGLNYLVLIVLLLEQPPALLLPRLVDRQDGVPIGILGLHDEDEHLMTNFDIVGLVRGERGILPARDDPLGLRADIDQELVAVPLHDHAIDHVAVFQRAIIMARVTEQLLHQTHRLGWCRRLYRRLHRGRCCIGAHLLTAIFHT